MADREIKVLNRIPKKYRKHIVKLEIEETDYYNDNGRKLLNYIITYDNGIEVTFDNQSHMIYMLKEYSVNGYYIAP